MACEIVIKKERSGQYVHCGKVPSRSYYVYGKLATITIQLCDRHVDQLRSGVCPYEVTLVTGAEVKKTLDNLPP